MRYPATICQTGFLIMLSVLLSGAISRPVRPPGATVHVFLSTECPVSQQYVRQLSDLQRHYSPLGIRFVAWFPHRLAPRHSPVSDRT